MHKLVKLLLQCATVLHNISLRVAFDIPSSLSMLLDLGYWLKECLLLALSGQPSAVVNHVFVCKACGRGMLNTM